MADLPPSLPGIDVASGLPRVAGNKNLYIKLLRHVAADAPATKEKLAAAFANKDATALREIAHSLKGSAGNLSIVDVAAAAERVESAAREADFAAMPAYIAALETALDVYVSVVESLEGL